MLTGRLLKVERDTCESLCPLLGKLMEAMNDQDHAILQRLAAEARRQGVSEQDAINALGRVVLHNERYRKRPSRQDKSTRYDLLLSETQPALALLWQVWQERTHDRRQGEDRS